jgi:IS5 family transposase
LEQFGIDDQVQRKGYRGHPLSKADLVRNKEIAVIRSGGERPFAIYKSRYGLARTRRMQLALRRDLLHRIVTTQRLKRHCSPKLI